MAKALFILLLIVINLAVWSYTPPRELSVSFLDVGQGDAVLIQSPTGVQILVDGGATRAVLRELSRTMPPFDQSLDAIVATHPDQDHIGGLADVLTRYEVLRVVESGNVSQSPAYLRFVTARDEEGVERIVARRGMRMSLGGGSYVDVLLPDRDVSSVESNTASIVLRVVYGDTEVLLTGDAPASIEKHLVSLYGKNLRSDVLKAGHHGSKTSSDELFLDTVSPDVAVFSRGCENRYGHPAPEVVERFEERRIVLYDTCEQGTVTHRSDGRAFGVSNRK